ncbi:MAG: DoxX family membrane protein [Patescibacteria group bacterium]
MQQLISYLQNPDYQKLALRLVLGFVFFISGYKIAFPADPAALAVSYANPDNGWIAPYFVEWINATLGIEVSTYLFLQGLLEMLLGTLLILGFFTTITAVSMGLLYWAFVAANPVVGEIRLSRDLTLMAMSFGLAYYGPGKYSIDRYFRHLTREGREEILSFALRFGIGFTFVVSALFSTGVMSNPLNSSVPLAIVFVLGVMLMANVQVKYVAGLSVLFLVFAIGDTMLAKDSVFKAFDSTKRELAFLVGVIILFASNVRDDILTPQFMRKYR